MLSQEALGALLNARTAFIEQEGFTSMDFQVVIEARTDDGSVERRAWLDYLEPLSAALQAKEVLPGPPGVAVPTRQAQQTEPVPATVDSALLERSQRHAQIRAQRKMDLEGAPAAGDVGPSRAKAIGRRRDTSVDDLVIEEMEPNSKQKLVPVTYCIACDFRSVMRNPQRIKEHAVQCDALAALFPTLHEKTVAECAERGKGNGVPVKLRTKPKQGIVPGNSLPQMDVDQSNDDASSTAGSTAGSSTSTIKEFFTPTRMSEARQAALDLALFQLVICAALPFAFVENPWLINFLLIAVPNYITPDRSAFFSRHITEQASAFLKALEAFLADRIHLTLSFDGWSSRAHDEIYTFHTTLPSRRSFLTRGHVFKGISVTGAALLGVVEEHIFKRFKAKSYSAVVGDGGPNVRAAKRLISQTYIWILNIYDPCHNLNLFLKDLGKLFKVELSLVSAISNFFGQSNLGTAQLAEERGRQDIRSGMKSASDTRFATTFIQAKAVQICMPALVVCVRTGAIKFGTAATKRLVPYLTQGAAHYGFLAQLDAMVKLLEAGANGITALEGQNTNCADVFYVWVTIAWHLEKLLGDLNSGLSGYRDKVIEIYNNRFEQMMTESSHSIFLLAYFLHPLYFQKGGLKLVMPSLKEGEVFDPQKYPELFKILRASARAILKGEQIRTGKISKADADKLTDQLVRWAVGLPPFHQRTYFSADDSPLEYWKGLRRDSNANILAEVAIIVFSIMPSELCDERTASFLGWLNAARRSSLSPEHLVASAQLSQWYKFGLTEGNYTHKATANVKVSDVGSSSTILTTPTLLDLLNDTDIAPQDVDREALEKAIFDRADPYDLAETDRVNVTMSTDSSVPAMVHRASTRWAVADYIRLDSLLLAALISDSGKDGVTPPTAAADPQTAAEMESEDWDVED